MFGRIPCRFVSCLPSWRRLCPWPSVFCRPTPQPQKPQPPQSLRLYVLDCGIITPANVDNYGLKPSEVAETKMITPCFLIVHPRGSLMWDTGEIPDSAFKDGVSPQKLSAFTVDRPLLPQLAAIGYTPANITYLALSHYHGDHVANASLFAGSTWIVQKGDRDPILAPRPAESIGNRPRAGPEIFRGPRQQQNGSAERRGS